MASNQAAAQGKNKETLEEMWNKPIQFPLPSLEGSIKSRKEDFYGNNITFKFNVRDKVYATHYKKNGIITHREYHDNGSHQWDQYVVRVIHDDGRSEAYEIEASWLEMGHKTVID